jgi:hypothetical protein
MRSASGSTSPKSTPSRSDYSPSGGRGADFRHAIERAIRTSEGTTIWYLRVIHQVAQETPVWTLDIKGEEWGEGRLPRDVENAEALTARWDAAKKAKAA